MALVVVYRIKESVVKVKKAVFPVAGMGTRFLPATKVTPKEMLPIVDKPVIQFAVDEAVRAGITELVFITSSCKRSIIDYFDTTYELEQRLAEKKNYETLAMIKNVLPKGVTCVYIRQSEPLGLGHAVLCAQPAVGNEPFAVLLADELVPDGQSCLEHMTELFQATPSTMLAVEAVPEKNIPQYGIVDVKERDKPLLQCQAIVEKPSIEDAPSNLGAIGRYIFTPKIFDYLKETKPGKGGEIQLTDAIAAQLQDDDVYAYLFTGKSYDCGNKLGYLQATVECALKHPEIGAEFKAYLNDLLK